METIRLIGIMVIGTFIGFNILYALTSSRLSLFPTQVLAASYGIGIGFLSLEMLFFYIFDVEFSVGCIFMPWLIVIAYNLFIRSNAKGRIDAYPILPDKVGKRPDALVYFLVIALSFEIFYVFFRALISPMEAYDALSIYAIKAKIFYLARSVPSGYFSELGRLFPHP